MRKFRILALLFALVCLPCLAEDDVPLELGGSEYGQDDAALGEPVDPLTQIDMLSADLLVGYTAKGGATVNPFYCNERDLIAVNQLVFESVVTLDDEQKPSPMLADNWTHEGNTWTFTLRSGITFHNGAALTADDVVASYLQFVAMGDSNPYASRLKLFIEDMQAVDDRTLSVSAKYSGYMTLYAMTFPVVQSATLNDELPRGTGPFWYVRYDVDSALRIEANPLWWKKQATLGSITFRRYAETADALEALQTGEIEMLSTRSASAALSRRLANLTSMDYGTATYEMLVPNLSEGALTADVNVRKAIMYAIDRASLASGAYLDMAIQSEVPVLPGTWLYESQSAVYYYSPERALQYLYDSGWRDLTGDTFMNKLNGIQLQELELTIITYNEPTTTIRANAVEMIADYLETVGIRTHVEVLERKEVSSRLKKGDYDLALIGVNLSEVPVLQPMLATGGSLNYNGYSDSAMDDMISLTAKAEDAAALKQVYSQIQLTVADELPVMGLLFRTGTVLSTRSLGGLTGIRAMNPFRGMEYLTE